MQAPFADFAIPPIMYLVFLGAGTTGVVTLLYAIGPKVTQKDVLAMVPWVISGALLHVFNNMAMATEQFEELHLVYPPVVEPLFAAPAVYLTTFIGMGTIWVMSEILGSTTTTKDVSHKYLGTTGFGLMLTLTGLLVWQSLDPVFEPRPILPILTILLTGVLTFVVYMLLGAWRTYVIAEARYVGALVLFAHLLDGISTAVGADVLGVGERSVVPREIMDFAATLPTYQYIGMGWLFVVVKMLLAITLIVLFADYVREQPTEGNLLFAFVTAVGLGPAMNNIFLFYLGAGG